MWNLCFNLPQSVLKNKKLSAWPNCTIPRYKDEGHHTTKWRSICQSGNCFRFECIILIFPIYFYVSNIWLTSKEVIVIEILPYHRFRLANVAALLPRPVTGEGLWLLYNIWFLSELMISNGVNFMLPIIINTNPVRLIFVRHLLQRIQINRIFFHFWVVLKDLQIISLVTLMFLLPVLHFNIVWSILVDLSLSLSLSVTTVRKQNLSVYERHCSQT